GLPGSPSQLLMKSGTPVELRLAETISSARAHKGDRLQFEVVEDIVLKGFTLVRSGSRAKGTVVGVAGKRLLGIGGSVIFDLDSVELTTGQSVGLVVRKDFKGRSRTVRMGLEMAIAGAIYWPAAPFFLLSRGKDRTVLKGTDVTAYTRADTLVDTEGLPRSGESVSELSEMINLLPPRVLNKEGREGDMLNLVFLAREDELQEAFARAGWLAADKSVAHIVWRLIWLRMRYKKLPMEQLYVYGRPQDYSFLLPDPMFIVARRHHVRIWKTGREVDGVPLWVGAATQDVSLELVIHRLRIFHKIDPNVDIERDFIAGNLAQTWQPTRQEYMRCADPVLNAQTAHGQSYHSDGRMLFLELDRKDNPMAGTTEVAGRVAPVRGSMKLGAPGPEFRTWENKPPTQP
ncbi:MAG: LssY C-terminal domain-containing protein, partial [Terracidiphilus sp.]